MLIQSRLFVFVLVQIVLMGVLQDPAPTNLVIYAPSHANQSEFSAQTVKCQ